MPEHNDNTDELELPRRRDFATEELRRLIDERPGMLKIITDERSGQPFPDHDPRAFVCHDVVKLEGPNRKGLMAASSAEGDWCAGYPEDLLPRLLQAHQAENRGDRSGDSQ